MMLHKKELTEHILQFPEYYSAANSIHIDDLSRNFALKYVLPSKLATYSD